MYLVIWTIKALIRNAIHVPTWTGIIISAVLGMLPLYLILCFFGIMGEARNDGSINNNRQSQTETYAEQMSRRYVHEKTSKKKSYWINYVVLAFVVVSLFYILKPDKQEKQDAQEEVTPEEIYIPEQVVLEEQEEETPPVVKKKSVTQKKTSNSAIEKQIQTLAIEPPILSLQEENVDNMASQKQKSTTAPPKKRTNRTSVRLKEPTSDLWEKVNRKGF